MPAYKENVTGEWVTRWVLHIQEIHKDKGAMHRVGWMLNDFHQNLSGILIRPGDKKLSRDTR